MRAKTRWAPPPPPPPPLDLQSSTSTLRPLKPPQLLPHTKSSISVLQDNGDDELIVIGDVKEDKAAALENSSTVAGTNRRSYWNPSAETTADSSLSSSLSYHQQGGGHWLEEDKIFPFKKRRILNLGYVPSNTRTIQLQREVRNIGDSRASRKCTKKIWADQIVNYKDDDVEWVGGANMIAENKNSSSSTRRGQRCRRINGHGWRCSQPSLVGFSLCEHHFLALHQSRVTKKKNKKKKKLIPPKSKIDNQPTPTTKFSVFDTGLMYSSDIEECDDGHVVSKRRIGVVKARTISSLLR